MKPAIMIIFAMFLGTLCGAQDRTNPKVAALTKKINTIIIPEIAFHNANLADVVQIITTTAKEHDAAKTGVEIVLMDKENKARVEMSLRGLSVHALLDFVAKIGGLVVEVREDAVVLRKPTTDRKLSSGN